MAVTEQIYIDGQLFELSGEGNIELVFQSALFTDLDAIVSNRTNEVIFPLTAHNRRAMKLAGLVSPESSELYEYRKHFVSYWRDGVHIFDGSATLLSWTATEVSFVFTWGNTEAFQKLFDTKLSALQDDERIVTRYVPFASGVGRGVYSLFYPNNIDFGAGVAEVPYVHPSIAVADVLRAIENYCGIGGLSGEFGNMVVPLLTKNTDREANILQAPHITQGEIVSRGSFNEYLGVSAHDTDYIQLVKSNRWVFDVSQYNNLSVMIDTLTYVVRTASPEDAGRFVGGVRVMAVDENGDNGVQIAEIPTIGNSYVDGSIYGQRFRVSGVNVDIDVSQYAYVAFLLLTNPSGVVQSGYTPEIEEVDMHIVPDIDKAQEVVYTGDENILNYPLYTNLPDWSMGDFVKNLMKIRGLFANVKSTTEIELVTIGDVYARRAQAYDWTGRMLGVVQTISPTFEDYAQRNKIAYTDDDSVKGDYNANVFVDNTTLVIEKDLMSVDFAGTDTEPNNILSIPIYSNNGDNIEYNSSVEPRILNFKLDAMGSVVASFKELAFSELVGTVYADYQATILRPRVLTVDVYLEVGELTAIDLTKPCYFEQLGHYYAIMDLTTKEGNRATATLLQLADK